MKHAIATIVGIAFIACSAAAPARDGDAQVFESRGQVNAGGTTVRYRVIAGETLLRGEDGTPRAAIFSTAYLAEGVRDPRTRPVAFVFNGGPGSASLWLHMGVIGPRRVVLPSDARDDGAAPYQIVANPHSLIDAADLVFIDPVGTGWSRALGDTPASAFWGVREDAQSLSAFIRQWLTEHRRWNSPKFLFGESYGTTRIAALLQELEGGWTDVAINGVGLISSILDFRYAATDPGNDIGHVGLFPTYAATGWYHGRVDREPWGGDIEAFLDEVREFALAEYLPALARGAALDEAGRDRLAGALSRYTGLSEDWLRAANFRIPLNRFMRELLRDEGVSVGRLDTRYRGVEVDGVGESPEYDPSAYGIDAGYTAAMLDYFTRDLGVTITRQYVTLGGVRGWNWSLVPGGQAGGRTGYANVAPWLARAMRQNADLRVFVANGYYDAATPFFGTELTFLQPGFDRDRVFMRYYESGHMMYIHEPSLVRQGAHLRAFVRGEALPD